MPVFGVWLKRFGNIRNRRDKAISLFRDGFDEFVVVCIFAESFAERVNDSGDVGFLDKGTGPDTLKEFFFFDEMTALFDKRD